MKNELQISQGNTSIDYLDLFDQQFSFSDFSINIKKAEVESESVLDSARIAIQKAFENSDEDTKYVVDMNDEIKTALDNNEIKLVTSKDGEIYAQLRNANGRFGKSLPIKKELADEGISAEALQMALQMEAIKAQLQNIIDGLKEIESRVNDIIRGQRNDRIGLFYSGLSLYLEARNIKDDFLRKQIISQALKSVSDANSQMIQEIRTSVEFLISKQYLQTKKITEKIHEHISIIHQCYDVVFRASFLKATIYQENGEIASMLTAIDEYGRFVANMIVPYAGKLSELDKTSRLIEKGTWGTIANSLAGCSELRKQLCENTTYLLSMKED